MLELENLVNEIGGSGLFQKRLLYLVLGPLYFLLPLSWLNEILILHTPDHWCDHPMTNGLNSSTLKSWKECYIPKQEDGSFDGCMIRVPIDDPDFWDNSEPFTGCQLESNHDYNVSKCQRGWNSDRSEFSATLVTRNNWFCDEAQNVPNIYTAGLIGTVVGVLIFSYLGDQFGRKKVFWITTALIIICVSLKTISADNMYAYYALKIVSSAGYTSTYQLPFAIIVELSDVKYRSWAVGITCVTWTFGLCLLPLIGWLFGDWIQITLVAVLPMSLLFLGWKFVPESPRWLLSKPGRVSGAVKVMREVAAVNKRSEPDDLEKKLERIQEDLLTEKTYGYVSLFLHRGLAIKTGLLTIALVASNFTYYQLMINISNMGGNTFLNLFLLSVIEGPACFLAMWWMVRVI